MNQIKSVLSKNKTIPILLLFISFEGFFICENIIFSIFIFVFSSIFSIFLLSKIDKRENDIKKKISAYSFFDSFLKGIEKNMPIQSSYESSTRYLISYQKVTTYDDIKNGESINLYSFQHYFDYIVKKDILNEAYLLNFRSIRSALFYKCQKLENNLKKEKKEINISLFLSIFILFSIIIYMAIIKFNFKKEEMIFSIFIALLISLMIPSILLFIYQRGKKNEKSI